MIGNDSYPGNVLHNARSDARSVAHELSKLGYITSLVLDANRMQLGKAVDQFAGTVMRGDVTVVYYAGHGLQVQGENLIVPIDFRVSNEAEAVQQGYSLSKIINNLIAHGSLTQVVILDACRNNPFLSSRSVSGGWADMSTSAGTFLAFGTAPGSTASDDPSADHGLFTLSLLKYIGNSNMDVEGMFQKVREDVIMNSHGQQVPWTASSLIGTLHMIPQNDLSNSPISAERFFDGNQEIPADTRARSILVADVKLDGERESRIREAGSDIRSLNLAPAVAILEAILSAAPTYGPALRLLGIAFHLGGRGVEAEHFLSAAIAANPEDARAYAYRCLVHTGHDVREAISDCKKAMSLDDSLPQSHIGLAVNLSLTGRDKDAYEEMGKALVLRRTEDSTIGVKAK